MTDLKGKQFIIIGAGPAGLTAAYELVRYNIQPIVLEQRDRVGGIARTETYKGYYFDMGGHRFFTKAKAAKEMWQEVLGDEFLIRPRLSRIYYQRKFFPYPLKIINTLFGIGLWQAFLIVLSFIRWQLFPYRVEETFEQWVTNRFGKVLFETFFKTYTEKVWGIPCSELKAEWAAQRIKDLSLKTAVISMLIKPKDTIKTLIEEFNYPRLGPGMLWNQVKEGVEANQAVVHLNTEVVKINRRGWCVESVVISRDGVEETISGTHFISSMPVSEFIQKLDPVPAEVLEASKKLAYRDFLTVCLIINKPELFPDNWIYVHSPEVQVGRIQNFKNWSPDMVPDPGKTSLGLEYFCTEGDSTWTMSDADLIELGMREIDKIGLAKYADIEDGTVFRVQKAYPIYDAGYRDYLAVIRNFIDQFENLQTIGRNGLHRYNNQDHSMITGMLAVRNLVFGEKNDIWSVNTDQEYQEELREEAKGNPELEEALQLDLTKVFEHLDPIALGAAVGVTAGFGLFLATLYLVIKDGNPVGPNLSLLSQFFPGYSVTAQGSLVGLVYMLFTGFVIGWGFGYLRNIFVYFSALLIHRDIEAKLLRRFLDYL